MALPEFPSDNAGTITGTSSEDMFNGGHRTRFFPLLGAVLGLASYVRDAASALLDLADQVAEDAASAAAGSGTEATVEALRSGTSAFYTSIRRAYAANVPVALTDAGTIAWDMASGINFTLTLGGAGRTLANPTNQVAGKSGIISIKQDATGGRSIENWGSHFVWIGDPPFWPAGANKRTLVSYFVEAEGVILLNNGGSQL